MGRRTTQEEEMSLASKKYLQPITNPTAKKTNSEAVATTSKLDAQTLEIKAMMNGLVEQINELIKDRDVWIVPRPNISKTEPEPENKSSTIKSAIKVYKIRQHQQQKQPVTMPAVEESEEIAAIEPDSEPDIDNNNKNEQLSEGGVT